MKDTTVVVNTVMILDKKNAAATAHKNSARLHRETNEPLHTWRHLLMLWKIPPYTLSRVVINLQIPQWFALKLSAAIFRLSLLLIPIFLYFINKLNMMNFRFFFVLKWWDLTDFVLFCSKCLMYARSAFVSSSSYYWHFWKHSNDNVRQRVHSHSICRKIYSLSVLLRTIDALFIFIRCSCS